MLILYVSGCTTQLNPNLCGNGKIDSGEPCDGENIGEFSCTTFGFNSGNLSCNNCKIDVEQCIGKNSFSRLESAPQAIQCTSSIGLAGKTGKDAEPIITYWWNWADTRRINCFSEENGEFINYFPFCDSTQFTIELFEEINEMIEENENRHTFFVPLMADGFSDDFRKDFFHYYKNIAFFDAPTFFTDNLGELLLDKDKLKIIPEKIKEPGIYKVSITKEAEKWVVEREFFSPPENPSVFYYLPINGEIGVHTREGESVPDRIGYGVGFSGNELVINDVRINKEIISTNRNIKVNKQITFDEANNEKKGISLELDLQKNELNIYNTQPNLILLDFSNLENQARELGAPFIVAAGDATIGKNTEVIVPAKNYFQWSFLYSQNQCSNEGKESFGTIIKDSESADGSCFLDTGLTTTKPDYPNVLEGFKNSSATLGSMVYAPELYTLIGLCGTKFLHINPFYQKFSQTIVLDYPATSITDLDFFDISLGEKCISEDSKSQKAVVFWNESALLSQAPYCVECKCVNPQLVSRIIDTGQKPAPLYKNSSASFWAQFDARSPISQPGIELYITFPDGHEEKQKVAFSDNGYNNDFDSFDNIYAATLTEGFETTGKYAYYIKALDAYGNEMESQKKEFEVVDRQQCEIIHQGGNVFDQLNIFIIGDNWSENREYYFSHAREIKDAFLKTPPASEYADAFNLILINNVDGLDCKGMGGLLGSYPRTNFMNCDPERVIAAVNSCGLPVKNFGNFYSDKVVILHNGGNLQTNVALTYTNARISITKDALGTGSLVAHELGHTFGLVDYYPDFVTRALGKPCDDIYEANCIMCNEYMGRQAYDCTLTFRTGCNLSVNSPLASALLAPYGVCPTAQKNLNDYEYMIEYFSKFKEGLN